MNEDKKTIGRCKLCRYFIKPTGIEKRPDSYIDCKKGILTPSNGMWGCWNYKD